MEKGKKNPDIGGDDVRVEKTGSVSGGDWIQSLFVRLPASLIEGGKADFRFELLFRLFTGSF